MKNPKLDRLGELIHSMSEEIISLRKENHELKRMLAGDFDPVRFVDVYNAIIKDESMIAMKSDF